MFTRHTKGIVTAASLLIAAAGCVRIPTPIVGDAVTDAYHKAHVGRIVFSDAQINRDHPDEGRIRDSFKDGEHIYARYYFPGPIANHYAAFVTGDQELATRINVKFLVDGQPNNDWGYNEDLDDKSRINATRQIWLNPAEGDNPETKQENLEDAMRWIRFLKKLSPGRHVIRLEIFTEAGSAKSEGPAATGEFTMERTKEPIKSGFGFDKIERGMDDLVLEKTALEAIQKHAKAESWKESFERVRIVDKEWSIERNQITGIILGRSIGISAFARWPDGHCTAQTFGFSQQHDGKDYSQTLQVQGVGSQRDVDCD